MSTPFPTDTRFQTQATDPTAQLLAAARGTAVSAESGLRSSFCATEET